MRPLVTVVALAVCTGWIWPLAAAHSHRYEALATVCIEVKFRDDVPGVMFTALRDEASRIWLRHGVVLRWERIRREECQATVPVAFSENDVERLGRHEPGDVLALTHFEEAKETVYVSVPRAARLAALTLRNAITASFRQTRTGRLLGRVVAHELGHVLLHTTMHTSSGLMRRVYGLRDVLSDDERMMDLSPNERQQLAVRFALRPATAVAVASPSRPSTRPPSPSPPR